MGRIRPGFVACAPDFYEQLKPHHAEPDGYRHHRLSQLQHVVGPGRHAEFWPRGVFGHGVFPCHPYTQSGHQGTAFAGQPDSHRRRPGEHVFCRTARMGHDQEVRHAVCDDYAGCRGTRVGHVAHVPGVFRRRRRSVRQPGGRFETFRVDLRSPDTALLPDCLVHNCLRLPDVRLYPHPPWPHAQRRAR